MKKPDTKDKKVNLQLGLYSQKLQRTAASTESYYLMLRYVFDELGFQKLNVY